MLKNSIDEKLKDICRHLLAVQRMSSEFQLNVVASDNIQRLDLLHQFDKALSQLLLMFKAVQPEGKEKEIDLPIFDVLGDALSILKICKQEIVTSGAFEDASRIKDIEIHIEVLINYWRLFSHCNKAISSKLK